MKRLLVANRGEIAVRIIRAARDLGVETVALYVSAEKEYAHVEMATISVELTGHPTAAYLDAAQILSIAKDNGCDAVHPGYGYLAENADFAELCEAEGIVFVGPPANAIRAMGDKASAREAAVAAGVPVVPGSTGTVSDVATALKVAEEIGYPLLIKATAGGGGKGMRIAQTPEELSELLPLASREAEHGFGDPGVYLEHYFARVRHIEMQLLADGQGGTVWLGDRECSIQRRYQKMLEEAPSPSLTEQQRQQLGEYAVRLAEHCGYSSAGTIEFVQSVESGECFFIEMNTRVQVEHPITEETAGVDIVAWQLRIASGESLDFVQTGISQDGHAIECRITAEDPNRDFAPSPGRLTEYRTPSGPGVRIDDFYRTGQLVTPFFDSMIAKVIVRGADREQARRRMLRALEEFKVEGISTTVDLHKKILVDDRFVGGSYSTSFLDGMTA